MPATDQQIIDALREAGTQRAAADLLGINKRTLERRLGKLRKRGWSPEYGLDRLAPDGFKLSGFSDMRTNEDGKPVWYKFSEDRVRLAEMMEAARGALASEIPREPAVPAPPQTHSQLVNCYVITDYHIGMYAWPEETGEAWDTKIAEQLLVDWFAAAIRSAPDAEVGILAELGDFMHWDGLDAVTPTNRHLLDADTRFQLLVRVSIRVIRRIVQMMLAKYQQVYVLLAEGNHNIASSMWMRELFAALYEDEPRVTVDVSADPYYCFEWGQTSLFFHHGHLKKFDGIQDVFAAKFREVFGRTRFSYAHMGHMHHKHVRENTLMVVEQHQTLAANDAYASRGGYSSERSAQVITYHRQHGEVGRIRLTPEMVTNGDRPGEAARVSEAHG